MDVLAKAVEKEKQIPRAFARLDEALDRLEKAIEINNNELQPLLRSEPNAEGKEMLKRTEQVPLASKITDVEDRVNNLTERLQYVQRRLEL